jgi:hypothetical protein
LKATKESESDFLGVIISPTVEPGASSCTIICKTEDKSINRVLDKVSVMKAEVQTISCKYGTCICIKETYILILHLYDEQWIILIHWWSRTQINVWAIAVVHREGAGGSQICD